MALLVSSALSASHRGRGLRPRQDEPVDTFTLTGYSPSGAPYYPSYNLSLTENTLQLTPISTSYLTLGCHQARCSFRRDMMACTLTDAPRLNRQFHRCLLHLAEGRFDGSMLFRQRRGLRDLCDGIYH